MSADVIVVGGGIVGCALAAFLAEGGAQVVLYEREAIAAGASGRNSGVVQDTLDPALTTSTRSRSSTTARSATASSCRPSPPGCCW